MTCDPIQLSCLGAVPATYVSFNKACCYLRITLSLIHYLDLVTYSLFSRFLKYRLETSIPEIIGQSEVRFQQIRNTVLY